MGDSPEAVGKQAVIRWGSALTAVLFAAASIAYVLEGASIGSTMFTATLSVLFGLFSWREWHRS